MKWTTEYPVKEGWYWFRMDNEEKRTVIVYVISARIAWWPLGVKAKAIQHCRRARGLDRYNRLRLKSANHSRDIGT